MLCEGVPYSESKCQYSVSSQQSSVVSHQSGDSQYSVYRTGCVASLPRAFVRCQGVSGHRATLRHARLSTASRLETSARIRAECSAGHTGNAPRRIHRPQVADDARGAVDRRQHRRRLRSRDSARVRSHVDISIKSTSEVDYQLELARDLGVMSHDVWKPLAKEVIELRKMLSALRRSILAAAARANRVQPTKQQVSRKPARKVATKQSSDGKPEDPGADD